MKLTNILSIVALLNGAHAFAPPLASSFTRQNSVTKGVVFPEQQKLRPSFSSLRLSTIVDEVETTETIETTKSEIVIDSVIDSKAAESTDSEEQSFSDEEYKKGFATIGFITLLNASLAPVWHVVFEGNGPPPLFLNAVVSVIALMGLLAGGPFLDKSVDSMSSLAESGAEKWSAKSFRGGMELGFWKGLGKLLHSLVRSIDICACILTCTSFNHAHFLARSFGFLYDSLYTQAQLVIFLVFPSPRRIMEPSFSS